MQRRRSQWPMAKASSPPAARRGAGDARFVNASLAVHQADQVAAIFRGQPLAGLSLSPAPRSKAMRSQRPRPRLQFPGRAAPRAPERMTGTSPLLLEGELADINPAKDKVQQITKTFLFVTRLGTSATSTTRPSRELLGAGSTHAGCALSIICSGPPPPRAAGELSFQFVMVLFCSVAMARVVLCPAPTPGRRRYRRGRPSSAVDVHHVELESSIGGSGGSRVLFSCCKIMSATLGSSPGRPVVPGAQRL